MIISPNGIPKEMMGKGLGLGGRVRGGLNAM